MPQPTMDILEGESIPVDLGNVLISMESTIERIQALKGQETRYSCHDYCAIHDCPNAIKSLKDDRKLMVQWCYKILDFFQLHRETAAIAMSYVDRFLFAEPEYLQDTDKYQLICVVALYVAVKVHELQTLTPDAFVEIGRGQFSSDDILQLESKLLSVLTWQVNPPTALAFVRLFLDLIPSLALDPGIKKTVYMLARAQAETATCDYSLVSVAPSKIAFVVVQNALEATGHCDFPLFDACNRFFSKGFLRQQANELRPRLYETLLSEISMTQSTRSSVSQTASSTTTDTSSKNASRSTSLENTTPRSVFGHSDND
jgi:Cyclin, N-terminal domain